MILLDAYSTNSSEVSYNRILHGRKRKRTGNGIIECNRVSSFVISFMGQTHGKFWIALLWVQVSENGWEMTHVNLICPMIRRDNEKKRKWWQWDIKNVNLCYFWKMVILSCSPILFIVILPMTVHLLLIPSERSKTSKTSQTSLISFP